MAFSEGRPESDQRLKCQFIELKLNNLVIINIAGEAQKDGAWGGVCWVPGAHSAAGETDNLWLVVAGSLSTRGDEP